MTSVYGKNKNIEKRTRLFRKTKRLTVIGRRSTSGRLEYGGGVAEGATGNIIAFGNLESYLIKINIRGGEEGNRALRKTNPFSRGIYATAEGCGYN